jgi:hypothetical protein
MEVERFNTLVDEAATSIPESLRSEADNVEIDVQPPAKPDILDSRVHWIAVGLFFVVPLLFYGRYLLGDRMLFGTDWLGAGSYVWREFMAGYIHAHGNVALWWPALLSGQPTVAGFFADVFYPTLLLRLFLPVHVVWTWTFVLHHFLAGLGTYLFLRELKLAPIAAALGGIGYELAGSLVTLVYAGHDGRLIGSALMPLALFFLHRGMTRRRFVWFALTGFIVALQLLSGHPQKVYYTGLILVAYFLFMVVRALVLDKSAKTPVRLTAYFVAGVGLGVAMSAIQYLPVYGNLPFASRGTERAYAYATDWSMPVIETFDLLTPRFSGGLEAYWGKNPLKLHSEYLGILPLLFAFIAVLRRWKDRNTRFFTSSFLGALLMAWGGNTPLYYIPYHLLPGISKFRGPSMIFFIAAFSLVVLAALGLDHILRELREEDSRKAVRTALVGAAIPVALLLVFAVLKGPVLSLLRLTTLQSTQRFTALGSNYASIVVGILVAAVVAVLGAGLAYAVIRRRLTPAVFGTLAAAVMVCDIGLSLNLWSEHKGYIRGVPPPKQYFAPDEVVEFLKQDTSLYRVMPWDYERIDDGILAYHGIQSVGGLLPNPLQVYQDFLGSGPSVMFQGENLINQNYMNLANIKYIIGMTLPEETSLSHDGARQAIEQIRAFFSQPRFEPAFVGRKYTVYRNKEVLPRAFVAPGFRVVADKQVLLDILLRPDVNPGRTVLLYKDPGFVPTDDAAAGTAQVVKYDCDRIIVKATLTAPGLLVLTDCYVPDWKVDVDGRPSDLLQAYHAYRAVALPAGKHEVTFRYDSKNYRLGSCISMAAVVFLCGTLIVAAIRRKRSP